MAKRQVDTSKKRNSILDAAVRAFVQDGYDNTSMDRIADLAGASKRTVYNHFPGKDILFRAVLERFMEAAEELKSIAYRPDLSLEEQLAAFIEAKMAVVDNPAWLGLIRVALSTYFRDPALARESLQRYEAGDKALLAWLKAASRDGRLRIDDADTAAHLFWSLVGGALSWPRILSPEAALHTEPLKEEIIRTFLCRYRA